MRKMPYPNSPHTNIYSKYIKYGGIVDIPKQGYHRICNNTCISEVSNGCYVAVTFNTFKAKRRKGGLDSVRNHKLSN